MTRQAVARATGRLLVYSAELESEIAERFRSFGRKMPENNQRQAYLPDGALPLTNPVGTAPCFLSEDSGCRGCIISLPGVPRELQYMMENTLIPLLVERMGGTKTTRIRILRTCGVGESNIDRAIGDLMTMENPTVGLAAHSGQTDVRITAKADTGHEADALIVPVEVALRVRLGISVYGVGKEIVSEVVGSLLTEQGLTVGVADTLTGGQVARALVEKGFGGLITTNSYSDDLSDLLKGTGLFSSLRELDKYTLAASLAAHVSPPNGFGLSMIGPFDRMVLACQ